MASTTLLVRKQRFDPQACRLQAACLCGRGHRAAHLHGLVIAFGPATEEQHGTRGFSCHGGLGEGDEGARLETPAPGIEANRRTVPRRRHVTAGTAPVGPPRRRQRVLPGWAITCALTKQHHRRPERDHRLPRLDQRDREVFGKVALLPLAHPPRQRPGSTFLDHRQPQRHPPHPTTLPSSPSPSLCKAR